MSGLVGDGVISNRSSPGVSNIPAGCRHLGVMCRFWLAH